MKGGRVRIQGNRKANVNMYIWHGIVVGTTIATAVELLSNAQGAHVEMYFTVYSA